MSSSVQILSLCHHCSRLGLVYASALSTSSYDWVVDNPSPKQNTVWSAVWTISLFIPYFPEKNLTIISLSLMMKRTVIVLLIFWACTISFSVQSQEKVSPELKMITAKDVVVGAQQTEQYFPIMKNIRVAVVANPTSMIGRVHLVDSMLQAGITVAKVFCPEHGFRGEADAGKNIKSGKDPLTGLPVVSLYGKH